MPPKGLNVLVYAVRVSGQIISLWTTRDLADDEAMELWSLTGENITVGTVRIFGRPYPRLTKSLETPSLTDATLARFESGGRPPAKGTK